MRNWLLPEAIEDILPVETARVEALRRTLLDHFRGHGYRLVQPPLVEHLDSLLTGTGRDLDLLTFKMVDKNVTLTAVPKTLFTITVTGGTVNGESTTARVKAGDWVTIKAENKGDDWKFIEWKLTGPENFTLDTSQSTVQFPGTGGRV